MAKQILVWVAAKRLAACSEQRRTPNDIQNGFRSSRSTADATQISKWNQDYAEHLQFRRETYNIQEENPIEAKSRNLDLRSGYTRDFRRLLNDALRKLLVKGKIRHCLLDLQEATAYNIKARDGRSSENRKLSEGRLSDFPVLFNIFHYCTMKACRKVINNFARNTHKEVGVRWS